MKLDIFLFFTIIQSYTTILLVVHLRPIAQAFRQSYFELTDERNYQLHNPIPDYIRAASNKYDELIENGYRHDLEHNDHSQHDHKSNKSTNSYSFRLRKKCL